MYREFGDEVQFYVVYIREAHALDSYLPKGGGIDPVVEDPTTFWERQEVAQTCMTRLALEEIPALVDSIDDAASRAYDAWPDRLFLIGQGGAVIYQGGRGPDGFLPIELESAIRFATGREAISNQDRTEAFAVDERPIESLPAVVRRRTDRSAGELDAWRRGRRYVPGEDGQWVREVDVGQPATSVKFDLEWLSLSDQIALSNGIGRSKAEENDFHSRLLRWWKIPSEHFHAYSTCERSRTLTALEWMESAHADLVRIYGVEPQLPATVILTRSLEQYNLFGITQPDGLEDVPPELTGRQALYHSFPCESWLDVAEGAQYPGAAAAYWESNSVGDAWGPLAVRHAAGLAFAEVVDPSPAEERRYRTDPERQFDAVAFWSEKQVPLWFRYGAATYVERYLIDDNSSDPTWARNWSLGELQAKGGVGELERLFRFDLDQNAVSRSRDLILRSGAVMAFILDGGVPAVEEAHLAFKAALRDQQGVAEAFDGLEEALRSAREELEAFTLRR